MKSSQRSEERQKGMSQLNYKKMRKKRNQTTRESSTELFDWVSERGRERELRTVLLGSRTDHLTHFILTVSQAKQTIWRGTGLTLGGIKYIHTYNTHTEHTEHSERSEHLEHTHSERENTRTHTTQHEGTYEERENPMSCPYFCSDGSFLTRLVSGRAQ